MKRLEQKDQIALIQWSRRQPDPAVRLLFHIPNGGKRTPAEGAIFKAMGVIAGIPDLFLPVARSGKHGLFIEMKAAKGKLTLNQELMIAALETQGYKVEVCHGWPEGKAAIERYMEGKG